MQIQYNLIQNIQIKSYKLKNYLSYVFIGGYSC